MHSDAIIYMHFYLQAHGQYLFRTKCFLHATPWILIMTSVRSFPRVKVKFRERTLLGRLQPVLAGVVGSLRLDDVEGVGVSGLLTGVLL